MNKEFIRVRSVKDITVSWALIIAGCILVALPTSVSVNIVGFFMIFAGILLSVIMKTGYQDTDTGEKYCRKEIFFPQSCRERILSSIGSDIESLDLSEEDKGNGLKMDIYYSIRSGKAFVRLYEYIPYKYEPASPTFEYTAEQVSKLIR
ncbi:MAG: hypothetical protein J6B62_04575 [Bacteroidales bacterium]|nr:hypothetical protein [Bacteroidales bacterium]